MANKKPAMTKATKPKRDEPVVVAVPLTAAMEMHAKGYAKFVGNEIRLTAKGRKIVNNAAGWKLVIEGTILFPSPCANLTADMRSTSPSSKAKKGGAKICTPALMQ
jgi:hypothetical protein